MAKNEEKTIPPTGEGAVPPVETGTVPSAGKEKKSDMTEISKKDLAEIMAKLSKFGELEEKLNAVVDLNRLDRYEQKKKNGKDIIYTARMRFYDNKPVVAWKLTQDEVYKDHMGVYHETQMSKIYFADGTDVELRYVDAERNYEKREGEIISRKKDTVNDNEVITLRLKDGQEFDLDIRFIN